MAVGEAPAALPADSTEEARELVASCIVAALTLIEDERWEESLWMKLPQYFAKYPEQLRPNPAELLIIVQAFLKRVHELVEEKHLWAFPLRTEEKRARARGAVTVAYKSVLDAKQANASGEVFEQMEIIFDGFYERAEFKMVRLREQERYIESTGSAIWDAARRDDSSAIVQLIDHNDRPREVTIADLVDWRKPGGVSSTGGVTQITPLREAAFWGNIEAITTLLRYGASKEACDGQGDTPLIIAIRRDQMEAAYVLINHGADVTVVDANGRSLLRLAERYATDGLQQSLVFTIQLQEERYTTMSEVARGCLDDGIRAVDVDVFRSVTSDEGRLQALARHLQELLEELRAWQINLRNRLIETGTVLDNVSVQEVSQRAGKGIAAAAAVAGAAMMFFPPAALFVGPVMIGGAGVAIGTNVVDGMVTHGRFKELSSLQAQHREAEASVVRKLRWLQGLCCTMADWEAALGLHDRAHAREVWTALGLNTCITTLQQRPGYLDEGSIRAREGERMQVSGALSTAASTASCTGQVVFQEAMKTATINDVMAHFIRFEMLDDAANAATHAASQIGNPFTWFARQAAATDASTRAGQAFGTLLDRVDDLALGTGGAQSAEAVSKSSTGVLSKSLVVVGAAVSTVDFAHSLFTNNTVRDAACLLAHHLRGSITVFDAYIELLEYLLSASPELASALERTNAQLASEGERRRREREELQTAADPTIDAFEPSVPMRDGKVVTCEEELRSLCTKLPMLNPDRGNLVDTICAKHLQLTEPGMAPLEPRLSRDQLLALLAYTYDNFKVDCTSNLYWSLNEALRAANDDRTLWAGLVFYLRDALHELPNVEATVYRGFRSGRAEVRSSYTKGRRIRWRAFSSTSEDKEVAKQSFSDADGIIFELQILRGKRLARYSYFGDTEGEVLVLPESRFLVTKKPYYDATSGHWYVQLCEIDALEEHIS